MRGYGSKPLLDEGFGFQSRLRRLVFCCFAVKVLILFIWHTVVLKELTFGEVGVG